MYYHISASGRLYRTPTPLSLIDFHLNDSHHRLIYSNASSQKEALEERQRMLLRLTQRRLEQWLTQAIL